MKRPLPLWLPLWLPLRRLALCAATILLLAGCASTWFSTLHHDHPLAGRVWDTHAGRFVEVQTAIDRAVAARVVILGEIHDNAEHHRLQAEVLTALLRAGRRPVIAMEQFDREHQAALDAVRASGERDPERIADAGGFDRKGWHWPGYRPLLELAAANDLPILAANLSRQSARALMKTGKPADGLALAPEALQSALEQDIVVGHCGVRPPATMLSAMVEAQRARDAQMALTLGSAGERGAILIAGVGHARRDRGVPAYVPATMRKELLVVAFVEVEAGRSVPGAGFAGLYDLVWFTPRAAREDPCKNVRMP